jgi:hypothetical protein
MAPQPLERGCHEGLALTSPKLALTSVQTREDLRTVSEHFEGCRAALSQVMIGSHDFNRKNPGASCGQSSSAGG